MKVYIGATRVDSQSCYLREFLFPVDGPLLMLIYIVGYMSPSRPAGGLGDSPDGAACTYTSPHGELFGLYIKPYDAAQPEESNLNNTRLRREY